jgi:hypothetical protein
MYSVELMIQARPDGRLLDHFRKATGGSEILEAKFQLTQDFVYALIYGSGIFYNCGSGSGSRV